MLDTLKQDIRYALRQLARSPLFTITAAVSLAMGIAVSVTVLSVLNSILFKPLPVRDPGHLLRVFTSDKNLQQPYSSSSFSDVEDFRATGAFSAIAASSGSAARITTNGHAPEMANIEFVSGDFFNVLGIQPRPRGFVSSDNDPEVIISDRYRRHMFKPDENPIGASVTINKTSFTIVGVAPPAFRGVELYSNTSVWLTHSEWKMLHPDVNWADGERADRVSLIVARLAPHVSKDAAEARLRVVAEGLAKRFPLAWKDQHGDPLHATLLTPHDATIRRMGDDLPILLATLGALIGVVLILGCTNVAGLLLSRAVTRRQEIAIRLTLGAHRRRLMSQLLTEALILASIGGAVGLLLAEIAIRVIGTSTLFDSFNLTPDWRIFTATAAVSALCAVIFGITPTMHALRVDLKSGLTGHGIVGERGGVRGRLMALQVCLAFLLMFLGISASRGIRTQVQSAPGINVGSLLVTDMLIPSYRDTTAWRHDAAVMIEQMRSVEGVSRVLFAQRVPLDNFGWSTNVVVGDKTLPAGYEMVDTAYFSTLGLRLVRGRLPRASDQSNGHQVAVVDRNMIAAIGHDVLGGIVNIANDHDVLVVGVVDNINHHDVESKPVPFLYELRNGEMPVQGNHYMIARVAPGKEAAVIAEFTRRYREHLPDRAFSPTTTLRARMEERLAPQVYIARIAFGVGACELLLAAIGLYSLLLYATLTRTREIGLRMALGARPARASFTVMADGLLYVLAGCILGLILGVPAAYYSSGIFVGGNAKDPVPFVAAVAGIAIATLASTFVPARKAARVEPMEALRYE